MGAKSKIPTEKAFYKCISTILSMNKEDAVKYIIDESISRKSFVKYVKNYLFYNPDFLPTDKLQENAKYLKEVKILHLEKSKTKEEKAEKRGGAKRNTIDENTRKLPQEVYIKNRYLLEEYVDSQEYIYTILNKYRKEYIFFISLIYTASTSEDTYDKVLYEQVNNLLVSKENNVNLVIENIAPLVLGYIQEGIKIGNELVPFTILDYYTNFGVPIEYFFLYRGTNIKKSDLNEIKVFFKKSYPKLRNDGNYIVKQIMPFNIEYQLKGEYTFGVNGEYVKPSLEERTKVMNYLIENKFPVDFVIYKQALKRYAQGLLEININLKRTFE